MISVMVTRTPCPDLWVVTSLGRERTGPGMDSSLILHFPDTVTVASKVDSLFPMCKSENIMSDTLFPHLSSRDGHSNPKDNLFQGSIILWNKIILLQETPTVSLVS